MCQGRWVDSADVKTFFDQVSTRWDDMRSTFYNADVIDALADHARVTSVSTVLDVGTGIGFVAAGLAGRAARVVGVDNSLAMLAVAADNLTALGVDNVTLAAGDVDALGLADESVDVAVANMVLHHAPLSVGSPYPPRRHVGAGRAARRMVRDLLAGGQHFGLVKLAVAALAVVDDDGFAGVVDDADADVVRRVGGIDRPAPSDTVSDLRCEQGCTQCGRDGDEQAEPAPLPPATALRLPEPPATRCRRPCRIGLPARRWPPSRGRYGPPVRCSPTSASHRISIPAMWASNR